MLQNVVHLLQGLKISSWNLGKLPGTSVANPSHAEHFPATNVQWMKPFWNAKNLLLVLWLESAPRVGGGNLRESSHGSFRKLREVSGNSGSFQNLFALFGVIRGSPILDGVFQPRLNTTQLTPLSQNVNITFHNFAGRRPGKWRTPLGRPPASSLPCMKRCETVCSMMLAMWCGVFGPGPNKSPTIFAIGFIGARQPHIWLARLRTSLSGAGLARVLFRASSARFGRSKSVQAQIGAPRRPCTNG